MEIKRIVSKDKIEQTLNEFLDVFPNLLSRVSSLDDYAEKLNKFANVVCVKLNDNNIAMAAFYTNDSEQSIAYISLIGVKKEFQGAGIGQKLFKYCTDEAKKNGMLYLALEVDLSNKKAIEFYKKNGMTKRSNSVRDSMFMFKKLD